MGGLSFTLFQVSSCFVYIIQFLFTPRARKRELSAVFYTVTTYNQYQQSTLFEPPFLDYDILIRIPGSTNLV